MLAVHAPTDVAERASHDVLCACEAFLGAIRRTESFEEAMAVWELVRTVEDELVKVSALAGSKATEINARTR